jgi:hypothetical protein
MSFEPFPDRSLDAPLLNSIDDDIDRQLRPCDFVGQFPFVSGFLLERGNAEKEMAVSFNLQQPLDVANQLAAITLKGAG